MNLTELPANLPVPIDDGATAHLVGACLPDVLLVSTSGEAISLSHLSGQLVIYIYPMTGRPDIPLPEGWDEIPGARGCTPQSCAFRDHYQQLQALRTNVFGLSAQSSEYQQEAKTRLHLPFELLSDADLKLKRDLNLPTFSVNGMELYKRVTLIVMDGIIREVFYPIFPPGENAEQVVAWLGDHSDG